MLSKKDFRKINDWLWEIPKSFRRDMRVPARAYISEEMLEDAFKDRSLEQLVNTAALPGIVNYSMAMPDMHEGYGFPIGGVAAMRMVDGVISPGGVGYDINCLAPDSLINLSFGTYLPIKELESKWKNIELPLINKKVRHLITAKIINFFYRQENKFIFTIKTKSGSSLEATANHPFYTTEGMKNAESLKVGDAVVLYPFKGFIYEEPEGLELVNKDNVLGALNQFNLPNNGNRWGQIIKWYKERDFLNLKLSSWQMPYLIKIIGNLYGDGTSNLLGEHKDGITSFYGKLEDLEKIQKDLKKINIHSKIYCRKRRHTIKTFYQKTYKFTIIEHTLRVSSTAFVMLLHLLGYPLGNKTYQAFELPFWLHRAPKWQKRLFLAAFFGAEMSKPATLNKFNFYAPTLNINKALPLKGSGIKFLNGVRGLLKEFGISAGEVAEVEELATDKTKTIGLRFQIDSSSPKLIKFFETIGFEYHREKQMLACLAVSYLKQKEKVIFIREKTRELVKTLYHQGAPARTLVKTYSENFIGKRFIEHSIWSDRGEPRIAFNFPSFSDFVKKCAYGKEGLVVEEIEHITKDVYRGPVYDLTIGNQNHNFIANNFVVSNCGMKLLKSDYFEKDLRPYLDKLAGEIQKEVPSGLGRGRQIKLSVADIDKILEGGSKRLVEKDYGDADDLENCESNGRLSQADASLVSDHAKDRGRDQVGTLGSGNHFLEVQKVTEIFDEETAKAFGLTKDQIVIMIHTGSRGLGHQIATDYIKIMMRAMPKYGINLPDRELAACPINSLEGKRYLSAMACGANFAWANRQMIAHFIRKAWKSILGENGFRLTALYDVAHNIAKIEKHNVNGELLELCLHRKGATRAFPPGHPEIPQKYQPVGQPVIIPGSMGTASYILAGQESGKESWFSTCHGAGRMMSRHEAMRRVSGEQVVKELEKKGIIVKCWSYRGIAEEAPLAYKNVNSVVDVVHNAGLAKKVARLVPLAVIKGE